MNVMIVMYLSKELLIQLQNYLCRPYLSIDYGNRYKTVLFLIVKLMITSEISGNEI